MVNLTRDESNRLIAHPVPEGLSGAITTLARAHGFIKLSRNQKFIEASEPVIVHLFKGAYQLL